MAEPELSFAGLLRQLRAEAKLTQEELAEAASLSPRSVSDLERGITRTAHKDTAMLLAGALGLAEPARELFVLAARGRGPAADVQAAMQGVPSPARHNLPAPLTSFLGREQELARLEGLFGQARLVTLTGAGGAGKTRLAVEFAAGVVEPFVDGVWLADLAGISDPGLVAAQVMEALGVRQEAGTPVIEALRYRLRTADLLLVLDNCEHLLDACAELTRALLASSPGLRVLATSREPLGLPGEVVYPVPPLAVPAEVAGEQAVAQTAAVRLFMDRGSAARGGVSAGVAPVAVAGRICRKLDGLPLAIELAAARLGTLSAGEIEEHLAEASGFLAYRRRAADPRHQALQTAMSWSYDLLTAEERRVFGELSVFAGSFGLKQAAAVCCGGNQWAALEVIDRLAGKSLVDAGPAEDGTRYRLLQTVRQYAGARLGEAGGTSAARRRHAMAFLGLAEREHELAVLSRDHDNFRAALQWSLSAGDEAGPRLAMALGGFWLARGFLEEGRDWLARALAQCPAGQRLRADLLRQLGTVLYETGALEQAQAVLAEGADLAVNVGAAALRARIGVLLAEIHILQGGSMAEALKKCEAATAVLESESDLEGRAEGWLVTGRVRSWVGDPAAGEDLERAIAYARRSGNHRARIQASFGLAVTFHQLPIPADAAVGRVQELLQDASGEEPAEAHLLMPLSLLYAYVGRFADARAALARSRSLLTACGARLALARSAEPAGHIELAAGDAAAAERCWREGYEAFRAMGERGHRSTVASYLSEALYAQGRFRKAQQMTEEAQAVGAPDDIETQARWRATRAKLLARRGQFPAARRLIADAEALVSPTSWVKLKAHLQVAKAEVYQLAGASDQATASLRSALRIYEDRQAAPLAEQAAAALASLAAHPASEWP